MDQSPHPLARWLDKQGISAKTFGDENHINFSTLYAHMRAERQPSLRILQAIEDATGGDVTIRQQINWFGAMAASV